MIKFFCDICGKEIFRGKTANYLQFEHRNPNGKTRSLWIHVCSDCALKIIEEIEKLTNHKFED
jgi:ribosome-binding protein aMBF1 (putative translation factor)